MTNRDLAKLLLRWPDLPACIMVRGMAREVERVRVARRRYLPPAEQALVSEAHVVLIEHLPDGMDDDQSGESAGRADPCPSGPRSA